MHITIKQPAFHEEKRLTKENKPLPILDTADIFETWGEDQQREIYQKITTNHDPSYAVLEIKCQGFTVREKDFKKFLLHFFYDLLLWARDRRSCGCRTLKPLDNTFCERCYWLKVLATRYL